MSLEKLHRMNGKACACGKTHGFSAKIITGDGVLQQIPSEIRKLQAIFCGMWCSAQLIPMKRLPGAIAPLNTGFVKSHP